MLGIFQRSNDWGTAPQQLGMTVSDYGVLQGVWSGVEITAIHTTETVTSTDDQGRPTESEHRVTYFQGRFEPALHMALKVGVVDTLGRLASWLGVKRAKGIDEPEFDAKFSVAARDLAHARRVLSGVPAQALLAARERYRSVEVTDHSVTITEGGWCVDSDKIRHALEAAGRAAGAIQWERRRCPAAWEAEVARTWSLALAAHGLVFDPDRIEGKGFADSFYVRVVARSDEDPLCAIVSVQCSTPFARELRVTRQEPGRLASWFRGQDIEVGDPAFDESFVVKGDDPNAVRAVLRGEPAVRLTALLAVTSELRVENDTLTVRARSLETDRIGALVSACLDAARALRARTIGAVKTPAGYR